LLNGCRGAAGKRQHREGPRAGGAERIGHVSKARDAMLRRADNKQLRTGGRALAAACAARQADVTVLDARRALEIHGGWAAVGGEAGDESRIANDALDDGPPGGGGSTQPA